MKKLLYLIFVLFCYSACVNKNITVDCPIIDVLNSAGKYKRVYYSDYFSSIELFPLETSDDCLLEYFRHYSLFDCKRILFNDEFIFISSRGILYSYDYSGKFLYQIGGKGQGPREYTRLFDIFFNTDKPTIFISDYHKILEYDFNGAYIRSIPKPIIEDENAMFCSYIADNLFIGQLSISSGKNKYRYCIFDGNGVTVAFLPNYTYFNRSGFRFINYDGALQPIRVDENNYLKDYVNDTIYILENLTMKPAYVYKLGKYTFSKEYLEKPIDDRLENKAFVIRHLLGTQNYFFIPGIPPPDFAAHFTLISYEFISRP